MSADRSAQFEAMDAATTSAAPPRAVHEPVLPCEMHWIEIECYDDDGEPMAGRAFVLRRASGALVAEGEREIRGTLDVNGYARVIRIDGAEDCVVEFPDLEEGTEATPMHSGFWAEVASRSSGGA